MAVALREELGPAMRAALGDDAIRREMAESARELSRSVVLGMQDGLEEIRQSGELDREPDTLIDRLGQLGRGGRDLIEIAVVLMALGLITVSLWLVRSMNEQRRQLAEAHKREAAILALTATLREGGAPHPEILDVVRRSFEPSAKPRGRWLRWRARTPDAPPGGGTPQPT